MLPLEARRPPPMHHLVRGVGLYVRVSNRLVSELPPRVPNEAPRLTLPLLSTRSPRSGREVALLQLLLMPGVQLPLLEMLGLESCALGGMLCEV